MTQPPTYFGGSKPPPHVLTSASADISRLAGQGISRTRSVLYHDGIAVYITVAQPPYQLFIIHLSSLLQCALRKNAHFCKVLREKDSVLQRERRFLFSFATWNKILIRFCNVVRGKQQGEKNSAFWKGKNFALKIPKLQFHLWKNCKHK